MAYTTKFLVSLVLMLYFTASAQVSVPSNPPQPDAAAYSVFDLYQFKTYDRETYRRAFSKSAKSFDPSRRVKTWFDSTKTCDDPDEVSTYKSISSDKAGNPVTKQLVISSCEASTVNLTGIETFPRYEVQPTGAIIKGYKLDDEIIADLPLDPITLSTRWEADQLASEIGVSMRLTEFMLPPPYSYFWPRDENRRQWKIGPYFAGQLIAAKNNYGVGRPGKWVVRGEMVEWSPDALGPTGESDSRPAVPVPVRDLLPNEKLVPNPFGVRVQRLDRQPPGEPQPASFTEDDRKMLRLILETLQKKLN